MNNTAILLLIGAGAFLWYRNKTKQAHKVHFVPGKGLVVSVPRSKPAKASPRSWEPPSCFTDPITGEELCPLC